MKKPLADFPDGRRFGWWTFGMAAIAINVGADHRVRPELL
jgi:hypothetical protein